MNPESLNIVILPDEAVREKAIALSKIVADTVTTEFILNTENYQPHITIYQGYYPQKNVKKLFEMVETISSTTENFSIDMEGFKFVVNTFLFWNCIKSSRLQSLHEQLMEKCFSLREGLIPPNLQELLPQLSQEEKERIQKTGGLLTGEFFDPHITITRIKDAHDQDKALKSLEGTSRMNFLSRSIAIGKLGNHGTISEIVKEFPFKG